MKIIINRERLLKPLSQVIGAVERRQTLPILAHVLLKSAEGMVSLTATDMEIEMVSRVDLVDSQDFQTTLPARKLLDICKALPEESSIEFNIEDTRVTLNAGRSRFVLASLPARDFPSTEDIDQREQFEIPQSKIKALLESTSFAMAHQDVRYYLNGILMVVSPDKIKLVATDGHRLAVSEYETPVEIADTRQIIIPRKAVLELSRLLEYNDNPVKFMLSQNHIRFESSELEFTSKLVDGNYPDYTRVIPVDGDKTLIVNRESLKTAMSRIAILSNEKYRGIRMTLSPGNLSIQANNPDHEEAQEELSVDYNEAEIEIGFNVTYLIDVLNVLESENVYISLKDSNSSCIVSDGENSSSLYVVMPMRL